MNWFPQIGSGSITQYPFRRRRTWRAISNDLENGELISLPDATAGQVEWRLSYTDLSVDEATSLRNLFLACKGSFGSFAIADPLANLLAWSADLSKPDWQTGLLGVTQGAQDPVGLQTAWTISNGTPGTQSLSQTVGIPGDYAGCFSVWVRSNVSGTVTLQRDGSQSVASVSRMWKQLYVSGAGSAGADHSVISLVLAPGQSVDVWGLQFEAQPYASQYKATGVAGGIYQETYFATDELTMTSTGVGLTACEIGLVSRV